jgi:hypothetical protein
MNIRLKFSPGLRTDPSEAPGRELGDKLAV